MERRLEERTKISFPLEFDESINIKRKIRPPASKDEIINISYRGACFVSNVNLDINQTTRFNVKVLPQYIKHFKEYPFFKINAQTIWKEPGYDKRYYYRYGIQFSDPFDPHILKLKEMLDLEIERLSSNEWNAFCPPVNIPSVPISSKLLEGIRPSALSVDITNLCNLNCKHCFWNYYQYQLAKITNPDIINSVKEALGRFPTITNILWYGGEPLITAEAINLIEEGIRLKKNNLVVTNGTFPIPELRENTHFAVSIDGTREIHDTLRGIEVYDRVKKNILSAVLRGTPVAILYCVNAVNLDCIPEFLEEWADRGTLGFVFTLYTPIKGGSSSLRLDEKQRNRAVSILLKMKEKYTYSIGNTEKMIELIQSKYGADLAENCPMNVFNRKSRVYSIHMCNDGSIRLPCALGKDASCLECRSVTKLALYAGKILFDRRSLHALLQMYHSKPYGKVKPFFQECLNTYSIRRVA